MLTLYSKETTSFSTLGIGVLRDFISNPLITEELNGAYTLEFQYAKDGYLSEYLIEQNIVKANGQAFRIWNVKKDMQKITILAKHIFFDLSFNFLSDVYPKNLTAQGALSWLINHAAVETNFNVSGNCTETTSGRYVRKTVIDAIFNEDNALLKRFGGELSYNNYNITVHEHRGTNANFSIRYKKNLTGIDFNLDFSNVATRIVPIGFDGITIPSTYVESGKVSNYFTPLYKTYEFSDIKYDPDDEEAYHTMAEAQAALTNAANDLFTKGVDLPQISISVNFVELSKCTEYSNYSNLESVNLGDTIDVIIPELNINTTARVNKTVYDCILERYITLDIGSAKQSVTRAQINIENQVKKSENFLTQAQQNAENLINHPFNGNVLIDKENGVIYLMDSTNSETAQNVWKWSLGGLGFSSTGINGTYTVAILQDGRINADFITTGQLNTGVIQGYDSLLIQVDTLDREFQKEINPTEDKSGTSFHLEDSTDAELVNFEMEGKTTQDGTPSPSTPSELFSVGTYNSTTQKYEIKIETQSKNLWDNKDYYTQLTTNNYTIENNGFTFTRGSLTGGRYIAKKITVKEGITYTFSAISNDFNSNFYQIIYRGNVYGTNVASSTNGKVTYTATANEDLFFTFIIGSGVQNASVSNIQVEKNSQATEFEPYYYKMHTYSLNQPLRSIGDVKDLLYIKNGMLYVERKIGSRILNGSENWGTIGNNRYWLAFPDKRGLTSAVPCMLKSNYFKPTNNAGDTVNVGYFTEGYYTQANYNVFFNYNGVNNDMAGFKTWLSTHNTEVQYVIAEPTIEDLGVIEIPLTYKKVTYINTTDELEPVNICKVLK